jgi:integrase
MVTTMASLIKKLNSQFWFACYRDANAKQHRKSTGVTSERKARDIARTYELTAQRKLKPHKALETLSEIIRETYGETVPTATVRKYSEDWLANKKHETETATFVAYEKSLNKFLTYLGTDAERNMADIKQTHVSGFRNFLAKKVASGTANDELKRVKMIFRTARRDRYISEDPAEFIGPVKRDNGSGRRPFTVDEIKKLLSSAEPEMQSLIKFGYYTGQRLADIATLTWANLDLERNQIRFTTRKTKKTMLLPIAEPLRNHISTLPLQGSDDPKAPLHPQSFATVQRQNGRVANLSNQFAALLTLSGLREVPEASERDGAGKGRGRPNTKRAKNELSFHSLRHTAVTLLKDAGIPRADAMAFVGHDSKAVNDQYTHVGDKRLLEAAAALPEV